MQILVLGHFPDKQLFRFESTGILFVQVLCSGMKTQLEQKICIYLLLFQSLNLTLLGRGGAESARTFFKRPFLHEKRGLEVQNFVTFPNSL